MAEPAAVNQNKSGNKPNGVDKWNAVVLTVTMLAVIYYAYITNKILTADTRPYVGIAINYSTDYFPFNLQAQQLLEVPLSYNNFGRQPAEAQIWQLVIYSPTRIFDGPSLDGAVPQRVSIWPPPIVTDKIAQSLEPLSSETVNGLLTNGDKGWLYVRAKVVYNGHYTDFCQEYRVIGSSTKDTKPALTDVAVCPDPATNSAD
jgi:hypothetical protein